MNKLRNFRRDHWIREQAGTWIARLDRGLSDSEKIELRHWLNESASHRSILFDMSKLWDRMAILTEIAELFPLEPDRVSRVWLPSRRMAALACLTILIALALGFEAGRKNVVPIAQLSGIFERQGLEASYRTQVAQQQTVNLPDRSIVTLNTDTQLAVHYTNSGRQIDLLRGEAHFKVAKDASRVFTVRVNGNQFKAVGTAFNVRMISAHEVELTVTEGRVQVMPSFREDKRMARTETAAIMVDAGKELSIDTEKRKVEDMAPAPEKIEAAVAWTHGMIVFNGEPLERAIREVTRYSSTKFVIADDDIRQVPVVGYFKVGDIDGLLAALQANFDIEAHRSGDSIILASHHP
jgi:transmembrane sensor